MKLMSKDGIEMMDVKSIDQDGARLVIKGKMMGAMATTIYLSPKDMWEAFHMVSWRILVRLPVLLWQGRRQARQAAATASSPTASTARH